MKRGLLFSGNVISNLLGLVVALAFLMSLSWYLNAIFASRAKLTQPNATQAQLTSAQPAPTPITTSTPLTSTQNWRTYISKGTLRFLIKYPSEYKIYENEVVSPDGVRTPASNTLTLVSSEIPHLSTNFVLAINYTLAKDFASLEKAVDQNGWCAYISTEKGKPFVLDDKKGLIFEDTPCGPIGSTVIYIADGKVAYLIKIESSASYQNIQTEVDQILSTFKFPQ